jgi:cytochrome oxidase Cu insertion factor (SCO1/SenC/PrrC family)
MNDNLLSEGDLSDEQRRAVFRQELRETPEIGAGRIVGKVPKKFMRILIATVFVLGVGGELLEHYYGNIGLPTTSAPTTFATPSTFPAVATTTVPSVITAADAFIGLKFIGTAPIPKFSLTDQHGARITSTSTRGKVTLFAFMNKNCNDICPVVGAELHDALVDLGSKASGVAIDIVNTDPFSYGASTHPLAVVLPGLASFRNVHFLSGSLATLNALWKAFGIQVNVGATASEVSHNSLLYFASPDSLLAAFATPFAHESKTGVFTLNGADVKRFAEGLALEAGSLMQ